MALVYVMMARTDTYGTVTRSDRKTNNSVFSNCIVANKLFGNREVQIAMILPLYIYRSYGVCTAPKSFSDR